MPTSRRAEISEVLRQRIVNAVQLRGLSPGGRLPSARALARELEADPRVVASAYRALAAEGVVQRRPPSRGFFAAADSAGAPLPTIEWLVDVFVAGLARGIPAPQLPEHTRRAIGGVRLRAACVECNLDQQVWLCRELEDDYGILGTALELSSVLEVAELPRAMQDADFVISTPSHEAALRDLCARHEKPLVIIAVRPDLSARLERLLTTTPVYFIGTDLRFSDKLARRYAGTPYASNARAIIVGRDDVSAIPDGAPAWVMRTAREALGGVPEHLQVLSTLRAFSAGTQRAILQFVMRTNLAALMQDHL